MVFDQTLNQDFAILCFIEILYVLGVASSLVFIKSYNIFGHSVHLYLLGAQTHSTGLILSWNMRKKTLFTNLCVHTN